MGMSEEQDDSWPPSKNSKCREVQARALGTGTQSRVKQDYKAVQQEKRKELLILTAVIREDSIKEAAFELNLKRWAGFKLEMKEGKVLHAEGIAQANAWIDKKVEAVFG